MYSVTPASCWCPSKSNTDRNKLWSFYFSCRAVMHQRTSYTPVKSPDTRVGKWALHSRWGKWDLKRLNRSGLPENTAQQPPAQVSTLSLFLHPPLCSHNTSVAVTCGNIILGSCSRTGASDMGSAEGAFCQAFHLWELMSMRSPLETKVARIILQEMLGIPLSYVSQSKHVTTSCFSCSNIFSPTECKQL